MGTDDLRQSLTRPQERRPGLTTSIRPDRGDYKRIAAGPAAVWKNVARWAGSGNRAA
jgi:hypothetical protein